MAHYNSKLTITLELPEVSQGVVRFSASFAVEPAAGGGGNNVPREIKAQINGNVLTVSNISAPAPAIVSANSRVRGTHQGRAANEPEDEIQSNTVHEQPRRADEIDYSQSRTGNEGLHGNHDMTNTPRFDQRQNPDHINRDVENLPPLAPQRSDRDFFNSSRASGTVHKARRGRGAYPGIRKSQNKRVPPRKNQSTLDPQQDQSAYFPPRTRDSTIPAWVPPIWSAPAWIAPSLMDGQTPHDTTREVAREDMIRGDDREALHDQEFPRKGLGIDLDSSDEWTEEDVVEEGIEEEQQSLKQVSRRKRSLSDPGAWLSYKSQKSDLTAITHMSASISSDQPSRRAYRANQGVRFAKSPLPSPTSPQHSEFMYSPLRLRGASPEYSTEP